MDKSLMIFIAIGIGFLYFVTNFVGGLQEEDSLKSEDYIKQHQYDKYQTVDSIGQEILDVTGASATDQLAAWNNSLLKEDFLMLFPDFSEMGTFAKERVRGDVLSSKLSSVISSAEDKFFSGAINGEQAKRMLSSLK